MLDHENTLCEGRSFNDIVMLDHGNTLCEGRSFIDISSGYFGLQSLGIDVLVLALAGDCKSHVYL